MRVLFVAGRLQPSGTAMYVANLMRGVARLGVGVRLLHGGGSYARMLAEEGFEVEELEGLGRSVYDLFVHRKKVKESGRGGVDIVHVVSDYVLKKGAGVAQILGLKAVATFHHIIERHVALPRPIKGVIAVSESIRTSLVNTGRIPKDIIRVIRSGVDMEQAERNCTPRTAHKTVVVGFVGGVSKNKGLEHLMLAFELLHERGQSCHLLIAGQGDLLPHIRRWAKEKKLVEFVTLLPDFTNHWEVLAATDILVLPSLKEGYGQVVLEAMACGRPVVATAVGAVAEMMEDGKTGVLVEMRDAGALAQALGRLINDPGLRKQMGEAAKKRAARLFPANKMCEDTVNLYREILEEKK